jgi:5,10-methylenetetrahydromethanopterin reductase
MAPAHVKFGIRLLDDLGGARALVELAQLSEELGFDTLWFPHDKFRLNSWVLNAAVAQTTSRIELFARTNLYTTDPSEIASFIATLDDIAKGRASLTLGLHNFDTVTWVGMQADDVLQRVREGTDIIRRLLRGEHGPFRGKIYNWTEKAYLRVKPYRPNVPILVCPVGEDFLELSGEIGDGTLPMVTPPESAALIMEPVRRGLRRSHHPDRPFDACGFVWMAISEDREEARNMLADVVAYFGTYLDPRALALLGLTVEDLRPAYTRIMARDREGARAAVTAQMLKLGVYGTPDDCAKQLQPVIDAGFNHLSIGGPLGRNPAEAMRLIARRVMPYFKPTPGA